MKRIVLTMALIASVVAGAMMLSAFTKPAKMESVIEISASPVWQGHAYCNRINGKYEKISKQLYHHIRVYPADNSCGAYYAVTLDEYWKEGDIHYIVKSNPDYNYSSTDSERVEYYSYYIDIGPGRYFFKM